MTAPVRLTMTNVRKRYGPTQALDGVELELRPGEVHALVGENGAGKSTLMKVLSGAVRPDSGAMTLDGRPYEPAGPQDARRRGVAMIYQELTLAPDLSVEANVALGLETTRCGFLRRGVDRRRVKNALAVLEHPEIRPDASVAGLNPAAQQLVEIARLCCSMCACWCSMSRRVRSRSRTLQRLFTLVRRLRDRGVTVVYISHFLEEVQQVADRFTVLRDGRSVGGGCTADIEAGRIVEMMVGRSLDEQYPRVPHEAGEPILELSDLTGEKLPHGVDLTLRRGEILGVAGVVGAGRTEMLRAVFGLDPVRRGNVVVRTVSGAPLRDVNATPRRRILGGLGMLSEDRKEEGLTLDQSIEDNLTYTRLRPYTWFGCLNLGRRRRIVEEWLGRLHVRCAGPRQAVGDLSGGNQQKVALGRLLHQDADVLLLDEPTRGVDVGSKAEIYRLIGELAAHGKAVLFVSSYLPELLGVCDRLTVMTRGRLSAARPVSEWTPEQVMAAATGV